MDDDRFDQFTKLVGSGQSRRRLLKTLAGGALGAAISGVDLRRAGAARLRSVGNACNSNADCASGLCVQEGRTRKICHCVSPSDCPPATDQCHVATCTAGVCGTAVNLNAPCTDGNACTTGDRCQANGTCGGTPVTCPAPDQCHTAGVCNPQTGVCSNPPKPNGSPCDDGDKCTQTDACQGGTCTGGNPVVCAPLDQCHVAGTCNPATGVCSNPDAANGTSCNDHNACTSGDVCQAGTCVGGTPVVCPSSSPCLIASCDPGTGCVTAPKIAGSPCDDATLCNGHETCDGAGHCQSGTPVSCGPCTVCDPTNGACNPDPAQVGTSCPGDGNHCHGGFQCSAAGTCVATTAVTCPAPADACHARGTCDPTTGRCSNPNAPDGTTCNDGDKCTTGDHCMAGVCTGTAVICSAPNATETCDSATGRCAVTSCNAGFADCNGIAADGCEVNIFTDASNCGGCGVPCPSGASCVGGVCACPVGQVNCGAVCADLNSDVNNCGICGHSCGAGHACFHGTCVAVACAVSPHVCNVTTPTCAAGCICYTRAGQSGGACGSSISCNIGTNPFDCNLHGDADCPAGQFCVIDTCCNRSNGGAVCVPACPGT